MAGPSRSRRRHERVAQRRRGGGGTRGGLQHRLRQLLQVERHAFGPGDDLQHPLRRQAGSGRDVLDNPARIVLDQGVEADRELPLRGPGGCVVGTVREQQEQRSLRTPGDHVLDQLGGRRIDPLDVLDQEDDRVLATQADHPLAQRLERLPTLRLTAHGLRLAIFRQRHTVQSSEQGKRLVDRQPGVH